MPGGPLRVIAGISSGKIPGIWQWRSPLPPGNTLEAIIYADGRFLAVGYNSAMMTSTNGVSWNGLNSDTNFELTSLVVGNGIFVAVGG